MAETEINPERIADIDRLIVHNGVYHADDVLVAAMLKNINPDISIVRTRTPAILDEGLGNPLTIVADVGMERFDHHQDDAMVRDNGNKYAACGLIFEAYPEIADQIPEGERQAFMAEVLSPVQDHDNGIGNENEPDPLTDFVSSSLPNWEENVSLDDAFNRTVSAVQEKLHDLERGIPLQDILKDFSEMAEKNRGKNLEAEERGNALVKEIYEDSTDKNVVVLPSAGIPWQNVLPETEAKFVVYETSSHDQVNIQAVPPETGSFEQKISLKRSDDNFEKVFSSLMDKYKDSDRKPFVHAAGFLAGFPVTDDMTANKLKDALTEAGKQMAELSEEFRQVLDSTIDLSDIDINRNLEISEDDEIDKIASFIINNKDKAFAQSEPSHDCDISDKHIRELQAQNKAQADRAKDTPIKDVKNKGGDAI